MRQGFNGERWGSALTDRDFTRLAPANGLTLARSPSNLCCRDCDAAVLQGLRVDAYKLGGKLER